MKGAVRIFETDCECAGCGGTGLYVGIAEKDGAAVVCHTCKGTGKAHIRITWRDFQGRKPRKNVAHVIQVNPGICVGAAKGEYALADFGGLPLAEWESLPDPSAFPPGKEMRAFVCPCWWYQTADYDKKPHWDECGFGRFSDCRSFPRKSKCWERWDREFGKKEGGQ